MIRFERRALSEAPHSAFDYEMNVRFSDIDAARIVFFARFFDYVHEAYEAYLRQVGQPLAEVLKSRAWAAPLVHVEGDYFKPASYGDHLTISLVAASSAASNLHLGWRVRNKHSQQVLAVLQTVHCFVSPADFSRIEIPEDVLRGVLDVFSATSGA